MCRQLQVSDYDTVDLISDTTDRSSVSLSLHIQKTVHRQRRTSLLADRIVIVNAGSIATIKDQRLDR